MKKGNREVSSRGRGLATKPLAGLARIAGLFLFLAMLVLMARPRPIDLWFGLPFLLAGGALRLWAAGYLVKSARLATQGPYAHSRHPLYLGRLLLLTGLTLMARLPYELHLAALLLGYVVFFGYYLPRKERVEGKRLEERHGEAFRHYRREVPALLPRLRPYRPTAAGDVADGWNLSRARGNREHWMLAAEAAICAYLAYRAFGG